MFSVYLKFASFRVLSLFFIQTYFVPDEYWQSLEIAHSRSFGFGFETWEYREGIRSYAYPLLFYVFFKILALLRLDNYYSVAYGPRLIQALVSAFSDTLFFKWCQTFNFLKAWIVLVITTDWFGFYCLSRTLINTLETNLVSLALFLFPWQGIVISSKYELRRLNIFIFIVCASCYIRPTAAAIWGPFCLLWLASTSFTGGKVIITHFFIIGVMTSLALSGIDSYFYGYFIVTPWRFFKFNLLFGISSFYGTHPFYWYYFQGIPVVLGVLFFPFIIGLWVSLKNICRGDNRRFLINHVNVVLLFTVFTTLLVYSFIPHKEFRFILPLCPMMQFIALQGLDSIRSRKLQKVFATASVSSFVILTLFFGLAHQRGSLSVMKQLAADAEHRPNHTSILILAPCHSTPLYSHIHVNVPIRFIQCEPPLKPGQRDESDDFFKDPLTWLQLFWEQNPLPTHVLMFDSLASRLSDYVIDKHFVKHESYFHTPLPDVRTGYFVIIYRHRDWEFRNS